MGASYATVLSELTVTLYQLVVIRNQVKYKMLFKDTSKYVISGLVMYVVIYSLDRILKMNWLDLVIEVLLGIFIYIFLLIIFKADILNKLRNFMKK